MDVDEEFEAWTCACQAWDAAECIRLRYKAPNGLGDVEDLYLVPGERCECACHEDNEFDDWEDE